MLIEEEITILEVRLQNYKNNYEIAIKNKNKVRNNVQKKKIQNNEN